jgi:hypothetical protein
MQGFGGMISFDAGSFERARTVAASTRLFQLAESLGGVESLISVPAEMTHASVPAEVREKIGLTNGLVRLSVGIESAAFSEASRVATPHRSVVAADRDVRGRRALRRKRWRAAASSQVAFRGESSRT